MDKQQALIMGGYSDVLSRVPRVSRQPPTYSKAEMGSAIRLRNDASINISHLSKQFDSEATRVHTAEDAILNLQPYRGSFQVNVKDTT